MINLTFNINLINSDKAEAITAEITEVIEKYNFTLYERKENSNEDILTFLPKSSLRIYSPFEK